MRQLMILASASAIGICATAAELQRGRLMRAPDHQDFPAWRFGPNNQSLIVNSEDETPAGFVDHPSKLDDFVEPGAVTTPIVSANGPVSEKSVAKVKSEPTQTQTPPAVAAKSGVGGEGKTPATGDTASQTTGEASGNTAELDAYGHPYDANIHAASRSKTKAGLWRLKGVGAKRAAPAPGYPLDL